ncbi:hypothetical protein [Kamptonema sp. UHCC 0994]|uniref:hypothetical protein n=1 Tax=Kamptonema sp. UHCC 0994 TaxID=3031329 RepID=UPI0023BAF9DD|nr:hypothetical protein [Kamptonema sp. UHCC 0994]MDF0556959.1 hypothetical protein [Kamptonema sp. UHCC 0994]
MITSKFYFSTLKLRRSQILLSSAAIALAGLTIFANHVKAQPTCSPPQPGEYLLLIVTQTADQQDRAKRSLPQNANITVCRYISDTVTRVGGFGNPETANDWVRYFQERIGLPAYAIQPGVTLPPQAPANNPAPSINPGFKPQPLGPGYAVLVDYVNQPQLAAAVQQALGRQLALVSYGQRSYLLATYTTDRNAAASALQTLSDRGFLAMLVDSRRVTLIAPTVK